MWWPGGRATRVRLAVCAASVCLAAAPRASAAGPDGTELSRAHDAYARGAAACAQGDYARGARELALADTLVPDAITLRAALDAVTLADDPVLGTELIARAGRSPGDAPLARSVAGAQARFAHRTGVLIVRCNGCLALVDGVPIKADEARVVLPGVHVIAVQQGGAPEPRLVTVAADETRDFAADAPTPAPSPAFAPHAPPGGGEAGGLSPVWFFAAASATVVLGAVTVWSAVDTADDHATFDSNHCGVIATGTCSKLASTGQSAQTRTTWLGVATGVAAVGTGLLAGLGVRWHHAAGAEVALDMGVGSASLRVAF